MQGQIITGLLEYSRKNAFATNAFIMCEPSALAAANCASSWPALTAVPQQVPSP